ncbi:MAG: hypothetical protein IJK28_05545 [Clostridia bacterium]|nr:hypothetical protein [Clostridia bacterium]
MSEAVAVALITGACAVIAQVILTRQASTRTLAEIEKRSEISDVRMEGQIERLKGVWEVRLSSLTEAVNRHSGFAERIPVLEEKIKVLNNRILDLERTVERHDG